MRCALAVAVLLLVPKSAPAQAGGTPGPSASVVAENPPRGDALRRAKVWRRPAVPVASADLQRNPRGPEALPEDELVCAFRQRQPRGQTPKIWCALPSGEVVKVKMGLDNPEVFSDVAAARLMTALGFPTDEMYAVARVRCEGCPSREPLSWWRRALRSRPKEVVYEHVAVERRLPGRSLGDGWAWYELSQVDPKLGGSSRAEVDALRLMAAFLGHWDNKAQNQRLVCQGGLAANGSCAAPLAIVQDLGGSFGPPKVDLERWRALPIWSEPATCKVSLRSLPYRGGTFPEVVISEAGRAHLAALLGELSEAQIRGLFAGARFPMYTRHAPGAADTGAWTRAFQEKVRKITEHRCPN
jgi:hypothetical protein